MARRRDLRCQGRCPGLPPTLDAHTADSGHRWPAPAQPWRKGRGALPRGWQITTQPQAPAAPALPGQHLLPVCPAGHRQAAGGRLSGLAAEAPGFRRRRRALLRRRLPSPVWTAKPVRQPLSPQMLLPSLWLPGAQASKDPANYTGARSQPQALGRGLGVVPGRHPGP